MLSSIWRSVGGRVTIAMRYYTHLAHESISLYTGGSDVRRSEAKRFCAKRATHCSPQNIQDSILGLYMGLCNITLYYIRYSMREHSVHRKIGCKKESSVRRSNSSQALASFQSTKEGSGSSGEIHLNTSCTLPT